MGLELFDRLEDSISDDNSKTSDEDSQTVSTENDGMNSEYSPMVSTENEDTNSEDSQTDGGSNRITHQMPTSQSKLAEKLKSQLAQLNELLTIVEKVSALVKLIFEQQEKEDNSVASESSTQEGAALRNEKLFIGCLSPHQISGVRWMKVLDEHELSGILADEMGMGKTVQVISFICELIEKGIPGPFLIVTPLSVLNNWESEFQRFAPAVPVLKFAGSKEQRFSLYSKLRRKSKVLGTSMTPVILTTYDISLREKILATFKWRFIIVDEGHRLKNAKSKLYSTLTYHKSQSRLLLTGTPLQNDIAELWALLRFVLPAIFPEKNLLEDYLEVSDFQGTTEMEEDKRAIISKVHQLLLPFILRRVKAGNMLDLPPKKEILIYVPLTRTQVELYQSTLDGTISKKREDQELDVLAPRNKRRCTLSRQPVYIPDTSDSDDCLDSDEEEATRKIKGNDSRGKSTISQALLARDKFLYSTLADVADNHKKMTEEKKGHQKLNGNPKLWYVDINEKMSAIPLIGTSSDHLGMDCIYMRELMFYRVVESTKTCDSMDSDEFRGFQPDPVNNFFMKIAQHPIPEDSYDECVTQCCGDSDGDIITVEESLITNDDSPLNISNNISTMSTPSECDYAMKLTPLNLSMQLRKIASHPYLVKMPTFNGQMLVSDDLVNSSGKFMVLKALLPPLKERGHKVLIFSTFKMVLDLLEALLGMLGYSYTRLDGTSSLDERTESVNEFLDPQNNVFAFLISTRAGGLGLNLIAADTVIIFDSDWNPQVDLQAQDRCHRIGQKKPVNVYRLVTKGTVDEVIVKKALAKRKLEKVVILEGKFNLTTEGASTQLDPVMLRHLLKSSMAHCVIDSGDSVLKADQIERLLKRRVTNSVEKDENEESLSEVEDLTGFN